MTSSLQTDPQFIGQQLLKRGFEVWMRYMFKVIEGKPFTVEPLHKQLLSTFDDIHNGYVNRIAIGEPPRAGKTTIAKYLLFIV